MKKIIATVFCLSFFISVHAQDYQYKDYTWNKQPVTYTPTAEDEKQDAIGLKDKRVIEFIYDDKGVLQMYYTHHIIVKILTQSAIEEFNKVYVPVTDASDIIDLKARSITKDGVIQEVDKNNIKKVENLEDKGPFQIFAIEGLEVGSEVEYYYTIKSEGSYYGAELLQADYPKKNVEMEIISPRNLLYLTHSYNGFPELKEDTTLSPKNRLFAKEDSIPALKDEQFATYTSNLMRVEYTLGINLARSRARILDWAQAGDTYFNTFNPPDKKILNEVGKFLKKASITGSDDKEKIFALDAYLKKTIAIKDEENPDFSDLRKIIVNKYANETGIVKLYIAALQQMGYDWELVLTSDREKKRFDPDFETWDFLEHELVYLPDQDIYLAPTEDYTRNGLIPYQWANNDGLYIKKVTIGDVSHGLASVKSIPATDYSLNRDDLYITFNFDGSFDVLHSHLKHVMTGYNSATIQAYYDLMTDDNRAKLNDQLMKFMGQDSKVSNLKVTNDIYNNVPNHPFTMEGDIEISSLIESAGNKYLFKVGAAIGPQDEMYNSEKRQNPVENDFNHGYHREITFNIPDGYAIKNLNDININVALVENGVETSYFHSGYTLDGNTVKIVINEDYKKINYTVDQFPEFQKVINASADFNKVVLVLEKK